MTRGRRETEGTEDDAAASSSLAAGRLVLTVFLPFAGGYYLSYLYRSINALIAPQLTKEFALSASDLGFMTAVYFLTFAVFQVPLGILLDRFGPRRVNSSLLLIAGIGALLFAAGNSMVLLVIGRGLIGLGVAGGLMAAFTSFVLWYPKERLPLVNGCFIACGGLGALTATAPAEMLLRVTDWHGLFLALALATFGVAAVLFLVVPKEPTTATRSTLAEQFRDLRRVYGNRLFWRLAPLTVACLATAFSLQGLWAGPWLRDVAGLDRGGVAAHLFVLALGLVIGPAMSGVIVEGMRRMGLGILAVIGFASAAFLAVQLAILLEAVWASYALWAAFGFFSNIVPLSYAALSQHFPTAFAGRVNTGLNVLVTIATFFCQYLIGCVIDLWPRDPSGGYANAAYQAAFGLVLGLEALAFLWFLWSGRKDTLGDRTLIHKAR